MKVPDYAHCKLLEFKAKDFRQFVYSKMSPSQQKNLHTIVAEIYERQAKKCYSCGGGSFFKTPNTSQTVSGIDELLMIIKVLKCK